MNAASRRKQGNFAILCLSSAAAMFNMSAMPNVINQLIEHFGVDFAVASRVIYYHMFTYGLTALFVVVLNRRLSRYRTLLLAHGLLAGLNLAIAAVDDFTIIAGLRLLTGMSSCVVIPTSLSIIGDSFADSRASKVGYLFGANATAGIVGATLSGYLDWRLLFAIPAVMSVVTLVVLLVAFRHDELTAQDHSRPFRWKRKFQNYYLISRRHEKRSIFALIFFNSFAGAGFISYVAFYLRDAAGVPMSTAGLMLSAGVCGSISISMIIGRIAKRASPRAIMNVGFALMAFVFVAFPRNEVRGLFFALLFLSGMARALIHNTLVASFLDFPKRLRGTASSLNSFIVFIGGGTGVRLMQLAYEFLGFSATLTVVAGVIGSGGVVMNLRGRRAPEAEGV